MLKRIDGIVNFYYSSEMRLTFQNSGAAVKTFRPSGLRLRCLFLRCTPSQQHHKAKQTEQTMPAYNLQQEYLAQLVAEGHLSDVDSDVTSDSKF